MRDVTAAAKAPVAGPFLVPGLLLLAVVGLAIRLAAVVQPLGIDQGLWASAVWGMDHGQRLYADVWEQRPPGTYFAYLAAFKVFGWQASSVVLLDVTAAAITTLLLWAIVRALHGPRLAAFAALLYVAFTTPSWMFDYGGLLARSISETFILVCVALSAWAAVHMRRRDHPFWPVICGLAAGAAVIFKPNAGIYFPALLAWWWFYRDPAGAATPRWMALGLALFAAALVPGVTVWWLWQQDLLHDARIAVVTFNRHYLGQGFAPAAYADAFAHDVFLRMKSDPVWCAGSIGAVAAWIELARRRRLSPLAGLALCWGAASVVAIVTNGARLYPTYFVPAYAPLVLATVWCLAPRSSGPALLSWARVAVGLLMVVMTVHRGFLERVWSSTAIDLAELGGTGSRAAYLDRFGGYGGGRGYSARANAELFAYVREHTTAEDRVYLFGINAAHLYFETERLTAHRFLRVNFFVPAEFPDPAFTLAAVAEDLERVRPRYLIFENLHGAARVGEASRRLPESPELAALMEHYVRDTVIEDFTLYRRLR